MRAKIVSEKGTTSNQVDVDSGKWVGDEFYEIQEEFMGSLPKGTIISLGKGTGSILAGKYPKTLKKMYSVGFTRTTNKGTSSYRPA